MINEETTKHGDMLKEKMLEVVNGLLESDDYLEYETVADVLEDFQYVLKTGDFSILEAYYK